MGLGLEDVRDSDRFVDVTLHICKLLSWVLRVALEYNLVIMSTFDNFAQIILLIDIIRLLLSELRQSLLVMWMEGSWVDEQTTSEDLRTVLILRDHALDGVLESILWLPLQHVVH